MSIEEYKSHLRFWEQRKLQKSVKKQEHSDETQSAGQKNSQEQSHIQLQKDYVQLKNQVEQQLVELNRRQHLIQTLQLEISQRGPISVAT